MPASNSDNTPYEKIGSNDPLSLIDEIPFEIPDSWEWVRLGDIFWHNTGKALNASNRKGTLLSYITTSNLYWNRFELGELREMYFTDEEIEKCTASKGDLLVCEGGDIGRAAIWTFDFDIRIQNHIHRLRPYTTVDVEYFYYLFYLYKHVGWIVGKGIGIQGLSANALHALMFPLPPFAEQKRIVAKIKEIEPYTDRYTVASENLDRLNSSFPEKLKKSILQMAVQGKLVSQNPEDEPAPVLLERIRIEKESLIKTGKIKRDKHESVIFRRDNSHYEKCNSDVRCIDDIILFDIPDTWAWVRLRSVLEKASTGPFGSMLHKDDYTEKGIPIVNPANIADRRVTEYKIKRFSNETADRLKSYVLHSGDVIIGRRGEMGRSAVVLPRQEGWLCGTGCFYVTPLSGLSPEYLSFLLSSPYIRNALTESSVGTTMNNLNHTILGDLLIPLPPVNEQIQIMQQYKNVISIIGD